MNITEPMKAGKIDDPAVIRLPCLLQPKLDGIRAIVVGGQLLSRSYKPIRNRHIVETLEGLPEGTDGELMLHNGSFQDAQSGIMTYDGRPDFRFHVFDVAADGPYIERAKLIPEHPMVVPVDTILAAAVDDILRFEEKCLGEGYEGVMVRSPHSPYKCGRSTRREGYLLKLKRYADSEAIVVGFYEAGANTNPQVPNAFGRMKRPGGRGGRVLKGTLGSFSVKDVHTGVCFEIGTGKGLTQALRQRIWDDQASHIGRVVNYTYQECGTKDRPRFPSFVGFRED